MLVGGEEEVLHGAGGGCDFLDPGDFPCGVDARGNGDGHRGGEGIGAEFFALVGADLGGRGVAVVEVLQCAGEAGARWAGEYAEAPRLGEPVGGSPMGVLEEVEEELARDCTGGVHLVRFDGAAGAVG